MKETEVGGVCSTDGRGVNCVKNLSENLKERDHSEDLGIYGKIILEWILRK